MIALSAVAIVLGLYAAYLLNRGRKMSREFAVPTFLAAMLVAFVGSGFGVAGLLL